MVGQRVDIPWSSHDDHLRCVGSRPCCASRPLVGGSGQSIDRQSAGKTALDILRERFARGEIEKEEFDERRRTLGA